MATNHPAIMQQEKPDLRSSRPQPTAWDAYRLWVMPQWDALIASSPLEPLVHSFLEQNPSFVPSLYQVGDVNHVMQGHALFSEPPLTGTGGGRRPDFMWIQANSQVIKPVFIEIERPGKKIFTKLRSSKNDPTKMKLSDDFTQARGQLTQWRTWWNDPINQQVFRTNFIDPYVEGFKREIEPHYILVYGRTSELDQKPGDNYLRTFLKNEAKWDETIMTYDRLHPQRNFSDFPTLKHQRPGMVTLKGVPPTLTTGPLLQKLYGLVPNPPADIFNNGMWDQPRSKYVHSRWKYWAQKYLSDPKPFGNMRNAGMGE